MCLYLMIIRGKGFKVGMYTMLNYIAMGKIQNVLKKSIEIKYMS